MYEAIRLDGYATVVIKSKENDYKQVARVPRYYVNDLGIAQGIAKLLNETGKIKLDLSV